MRIAQSQVQMSSAHQSVSRHEVRQRLSLTVPGATGQAAAPALSTPAAEPTRAQSAREALRANLHAGLTGAPRSSFRAAQVAPSAETRPPMTASQAEAAADADAPAAKIGRAHV